MPIVNAGGVEIESVLSLPDVKTTENASFCFKGVNTNNYAVQLMPKPACGCTTAGGTFTVLPGDEFEVAGTLSPRKSVLNYTKTITLHIAKVTHNIEYTDQLVLTFSGKTVN